MVPSPSSQKSETFGRYEVIARIGRGGMGSVYLARAVGEGGFNRLFIVKVIHDHLGGDQQFVDMMQGEARIAARLHHPNVVSIVDVGTAGDSFYIVMDYVEGCTLADLLNHHQNTRPPRLIVPILLDALSGLQAAHDLVDDDGRPLRLVHRDVSPENMLVGVDGHCRLIDFGIAKAKGTPQVTSPGVIRGKPAYMSPEQVSNHSIDPRSDLFSAGIVLYNALTGRRLFDGTSPHATMYNILKRTIPPPSRIGLHPPACFDAVCLKALERNPDKRFQSAEEMGRALREAAMQANLLGAPGDVARFVSSTFGEKLEERKERTREFLRSKAKPVTSQVMALPELTLSVSSLQPVVTPTSTDQQSMLTWDDLSRENEAPGPESLLPSDPQLLEALAAPTSASISGTHDSLPPDFKRNPSRVAALALGVAALVGGALFVGVQLGGAGTPSPTNSSASQPFVSDRAQPTTAQQAAVALPQAPIASSSGREPSIESAVAGDPTSETELPREGFRPDGAERVVAGAEVPETETPRRPARVAGPGKREPKDRTVSARASERSGGASKEPASAPAVERDPSRDVKPKSKTTVEQNPYLRTE